MARDKTEIEAEMKEMEAHMAEAGFWSDKRHAQEVIVRYEELKGELEGVGKYDKGNAIITIFAGAGGDDAEDFASILYQMYQKYIGKKDWSSSIIHQNMNNHGGLRNVTFEVIGKNAYAILKNESGVHRLVRISPFSAQKKRHTSFAMVEVIPKLPETKDLEIPEGELKIDYAKSSGPGGQNVNKRETAVRIIHEPTGLGAHADSERSQSQNKEKALEILRGKLYKYREEEREKKEGGMKISKSTQVEWGNQIRSYVNHPYTMVKDHRTGLEIRDVDSVFEGDIDKLLEAEKDL